MKSKNLGVRVFALCTFAFVFVYISVFAQTTYPPPDFTITAQIGQGEQNSQIFITNSATSCNITASVSALGWYPINPVDGPDWTVTMTPLDGTGGFTFASADDTEQYQKTGTRAAHTPTVHGTFMSPLVVTIRVTITFGSGPDSPGAVSKTVMKHIAQDPKDQLRQEYVDHGISVPSRSDFTSSSNYNNGDYDYAIDCNLAGRHSAWAAACGVTQSDLRLSSGYRNPEHNRHHISPAGALRSRHQYGDTLDIYTIDLNNDGNIDKADSDKMIDAAEEEAGASWTDDYPPNYVHVHADWR